MKVHVPQNDLVFTDFGTVIGSIYLDVNGVMFPEKNWKDFPFILFGWWWDGLMKLNADPSAEFLFMDGDFEFILEKNAQCAEQMADVTLLDSGEPVDLKSSEISLKSFKDSFLQTAKQMVAIAHSKNWENSDIKGLNIRVNGFDSQYKF